MKLLYVLFALLTLAFAKPHECECPLVSCISTQPEQCQCQNAAAIACAKRCGTKPTILPCPTPPTTTSTALKPTSTPCGSRGMAPCAADQYCIADPNNLSCSLIADCPGLCVKFDGPDCAGFAGLRCPAKDQVCVDDPRDECDPGAGGRDCIGKCVRLNGGSSA